MSHSPVNTGCRLGGESSLSENPTPQQLRQACGQLQKIPAVLQKKELPKATGGWIGQTLLTVLEAQGEEGETMKDWVSVVASLPESSLEISGSYREKIFHVFRDHPPQSTGGFWLMTHLKELSSLFELDWWWELHEKQPRWQQIGGALVGHPETRGEDVPDILEAFSDDPPVESLEECKHLLENPEARKACLKHPSLSVVRLLLPGQNPEEQYRICQHMEAIHPMVGAAYLVTLPPEQWSRIERKALLPFLQSDDRVARSMVFRKLGNPARGR